MLLIFDGVITSRLAPPRDSDVLGSDVARQLVNVLSRHPLEAKHWVDAVVSANFERGSEEGSFIIPEAVTHEVMYTEEHVPEEGTTVQTSKAGSFGKARDRYTELTAFMTEYQEILTELARIKPGLFGKGALERLNRRYLTLMEINATDDAGGRERLFKEAKEANVLPYAWPAALEEDDFNMRVLEEIEALNDLLGRDVLDERPQRWRNGRPPAEGVQDLEIGFEESDWLKEDGTPRFETGDGRLLEDIQAELDPMQRLLDLHASALARDIDIIITTMRVVGAKPREAWQACLDDMPGLKEMENMWRPNEKGMEAEGRDKVLERAGLLPGRDTPLLALPASVQGRSVRGNANLLTAGKVAGAIRSAEGAAMMASVKGDGTTALTVVEQYTNKDNTLLQIGALMHELKSAALEGNKAGTGSAIRRLEDLMGRERGALLAEFASGRGRMAEVFGRNFGADARARLADVAGKLDPAGAARGRGPKRDNPLKRGK
jgi:hypothetical protein